VVIAPHLGHSKTPFVLLPSLKVLTSFHVWLHWADDPFDRLHFVAFWDVAVLIENLLS